MKGILLQVNDYMTHNWVKFIFYSLGYTNKEGPGYKNLFHEVGQILRTCNENMDQHFSHGWITCLDASISFWSNTYNRP